MQARCLKCKADQEMKNMQEITMKGKGGSTRRAAKGVCPVCGTTMFKFLPKK